MSRVWSSRATMSEGKLKVKLGSEISPSKYGSNATGAVGAAVTVSTTEPSSRKRKSLRRGVTVSPVAAEASDSSESPTPKRGRTRDRRKKIVAKKGRTRSSSSSSLSSLSSLSRSRSRSSSSSSDEPVARFTATPLEGINGDYYKRLEEDVNREKKVDKCRTSKKSIQYIDHTKNRSTTYLKRSGSLIMASKELEIQTHCHVALHIQPTWPRGKQYNYASGTNVKPIKNAEYAERWAGSNMCRVCGEQTETSLWMVCGHQTRNRECSYRAHCNCLGLYYTSRLEVEQVPFYCYKHGKYHLNEMKGDSNTGESD